MNKTLFLSLTSFLFLLMIDCYAQNFPNKAASFNGINSYIAVPDGPELNPTTAITIESWVYLTGIGNGNPTIVGKRWQNNYWFGFTGQQLRFYPKGGTHLTGSILIPFNQWTHVAGTYDGTKTKLYINGICRDSSTSITGAITPNTDSLCIGADRDAPTSRTYFLPGRLDNVRIWNVARSQQQIQDNMFITLQVRNPTNKYTGLAASYILDGYTNEYSGAEFNHGFARNISYVDYSTQPVNYVDYNNSLVLDGNSYVAAPNSVDGDFNSTTAVTLEAWIKRNLSSPLPPAGSIVTKCSSVDIDYTLYLEGNKLIFGTNTGLVKVESESAILDETWHHIAGSYNSVDGIAILYVDGVEVKRSTTTSRPLIINTPTDSLFIGGWHPTSANAAFKFKGQIDEVRIWKDVARTSGEIKSSMFVTRGYTSGASASCTYSFNNYTNYISNMASGINPAFYFRGNSYISSSHLQNNYTSPILFSYPDFNYYTDYVTSINRTIIPASGTVSDSVNISSTGNVSSVKAFVLLNHGSIGKLSMELISPTGIRVNLLPAQNAALTDHDIITVFDPSADSTISFTSGSKAPFSPKIKPFGNFSSFYGSRATGHWKLKITDASTGTMLRLLNGWGLKLTTTPVGVEDNFIPNQFELNQNYPNPFNPITTISYKLPVSSFVTLKVFDMIGREVSILVSEYKQPGTYHFRFSTLGSTISSGVYFYQLKAGNFMETKKFVLQK